MPDIAYYVLDQHRHILCVETALEAALDLIEGLPPGYVIVDENDAQVSLETLQ